MTSSCRKRSICFSDTLNGFQLDKTGLAKKRTHGANIFSQAISKEFVNILVEKEAQLQ